MQKHDYFYGNETTQFSFYRIPRLLFTDDDYCHISSDAKILYGLMLDRMDLSIKNEWLNDKGRAYIYFTLDSIQEKMGCCRSKATKMLDELDKKTGLIERVHQGQGKPTKIYVKKFISAPEKSKVQDSDSKAPVKQTPRSPENRSLEVGKTDSNQTEKNKTIENHTEYQSIYLSDGNDTEKTLKEMDRMDGIDFYRELVKENIDYAVLTDNNQKERMDEIVELIADTISTAKPTIRIGGDEYPAEVVKGRLLKLESTHIEYVFDCIDKNTTKVHNIKAYLLTALYNAPATIERYGAAPVNHDLHG